MTTPQLAGPATWGITGPSFLVLYVAFAAVVLGGGGLAVATHRRRADETPAGPVADPARLTPAQLGLLTGDPRRAVAAALADARDTRDDPPTAGVALRKPALRGDAVVRAIGDTTGGRVPPLGVLLARPAVRAALEAERDALTRAGLLGRGGRRDVLLAAVGAAAGLTVLGVARIAAGLAHGRPVGFLVVLVAATPFAARAVLRAAWTRRATPAGRDVLDRARAAHEHLRPSYDPAFGAYGRGTLALATALFGTSVLLGAEPALADELGIRASRSWASAGDGGGGCGGGSCGSSCGGGCGGGGCGG